MTKTAREPQDTRLKSLRTWYGMLATLAVECALGVLSILYASPWMLAAVVLVAATIPLQLWIYGKGWRGLVETAGEVLAKIKGGGA
jgi:Flp pilus assembly protein TadB